MKLTIKDLDDSSVNIDIPGQININQDSEAKIRVENKNSAIGIIDDNFCLLLEKDGAVSKLTFNQDKSKIVCTAYYRDEKEILHKKEDYAVIDFVEEKVEEKYLPEDINDSGDSET